MEEIVVESDLLEEWLRTAFLDDDGQVFLPCGACDDELSQVLSLIHDRVPVVRHEGHVYAPASWLAKEHPRFAETIDTIAASVRNGKGGNAAATELIST